MKLVQYIWKSCANKSVMDRQTDEQAKNNMSPHQSRGGIITFAHLQE